MKNRRDDITSIVVVGRDKFSPTEKCLDSILEYTPEPHELILVLGGAPQAVKDRLESKYKDKVRFVYRDQYLSPTRSRNIGLREAQGRLAVLMDNDVQAKPDWLKAMLDSQKEAGAALVSPLVLESEKKIHTAANHIYVTQKNGKAYGHKELMFHGKIVEESTNLKRQETEYSELHCHLVDAQTMLDLQTYDEKIMEVAECDLGFTLQKAGKKMVFEPKAIVYYMLGCPVAVEDIQFFIWRWDMKTILDGYKHFEDKWGVDITEHGKFRRFLLMYNGKVGFWSRKYPSEFGMKLDRIFTKLGWMPDYCLKVIRRPWRNHLAKRLGFYDWQEVA